MLSFLLPQSEKYLQTPGKQRVNRVKYNKSDLKVNTEELTTSEADAANVSSRRPEFRQLICKRTDV